MNADSTETSDQVTVMVFKDNYSARTFQIPLNWISRFGLLIGILLCVAVLTTFATVKYYRMVLKTDPHRVQDMEQELADLKNTLKEQESKASVKTLAPSPNAPKATESLAHSGSNPFSLSGFPEGVEDHLPPASSLPFTVQAPKAYWDGKTLRVRLALQYIENDKGNQQGRVLVLARGPGRLLASPPEVINAAAGSDHLIDPEKGEYFSVSRFREVKADFGPMSSREALREVEVFVFDDNSQILAYEKILPKEFHPRNAESPNESEEQ